MGRVIANMSMSLDGFIEDSGGGVQHVFAWTMSGGTEPAIPGVERMFRTSRASADHLQEAISGTGALVCGRRLFDLTSGWGGHHPIRVPVFVVTHQPPRD